MYHFTMNPTILSGDSILFLVGDPLSIEFIQAGSQKRLF